jgi:hypothetical protein
MPSDRDEQPDFLRRAVFLTLRARVDYTYKFDTCRLGGLTVAVCLQGEPAAFT